MRRSGRPAACVAGLRRWGPFLSGVGIGVVFSLMVGYALGSVLL
jgi:hypothetical protein